MKTDLFLLRLANEMELPDTDPAQAIQSLLGEVVIENSDGSLSLREEGKAKAVEFIRDLFRKYREVRRKGRRIDEITEGMLDDDLREAFQSMGGKFVISRLIENSLREHRLDGLELWVKNHFEPADGGLALREGAEEGIHEFLRHAEELAEEFEHD